MTIEQYLHRLCQNILNERFDWRKYLTTRSYFGRDLCVTPLHVSYGQIGYTIHFPYSRDPMPELAYDWEMNDLTIDEEDWQKWLSPKEDDEKTACMYHASPIIRFLLLVSFTRNGARRLVTIGTSVVMVATI